MMKKDEIAHLKRDNEQFLEEEKERLQTDSVQETAEVRQFYQILIDGYAQGGPLSRFQPRGWCYICQRLRIRMLYRFLGLLFSLFWAKGWLLVASGE